MNLRDYLTESYKEEMDIILKSLRNQYLAMDSDTRHIKAAKQVAKKFKMKYQDILKEYTPSNNIKGVKTWDKQGNIK